MMTNSQLPLTARQKQILSFFKAFHDKYGTPPSIREVASYFGLSSTNAVGCHIKPLIKKGYLKQIGKGLSRSLIVVKPEHREHLEHRVRDKDERSVEVRISIDGEVYLAGWFVMTGRLNGLYFDVGIQVMQYSINKEDTRPIYERVRMEVDYGRRSGDTTTLTLVREEDLELLRLHPYFYEYSGKRNVKV